MKSTIALICSLLLYNVPAVAAQPLHIERVSYRVGDTTLKSYLAYDAQGAGKRLGVLVVHEWWGLNDYVRRRARELAELGYVALAVDMYGNGKATEDPDQAGAWAGAVDENFELERARFTAALDVLREQEHVDPARIAATGYCFGGTVVLNMARAGVDVDGVVSFHGALPVDNPPEQGEVKADVLVLHGAADEYVTREQMASFKRQMRSAGADFKVVAYPGAQHSFTNPAADEFAKLGFDIAYDARADRASWRDMRAFLARVSAN